MLDVEIVRRSSDRHVHHLGDFAIGRNAHGHGAGCGVVFDTELHRAALADNAVAWCTFENNPSVALVAQAGQNGVHRATVAAVCKVFRNVVDLAVRHQDGAGEAVGRDVCQSAEET